MSPSASPGYSGRSLQQKLGIKPGFRVFVVGAPTPYDKMVGKLPAGASIVSRATSGLDVVHIFAPERKALAGALARHRDAVEPDGMIWISWPKKASKLPTDLTDNVLREVALPLGLVDVKVCAVDATWSGLKFVIRRELRA